MYLFVRYPLNTPLRNSLGEKSSATEDDKTFEMLARAYDSGYASSNTDPSSCSYRGLVHGAEVLDHKGTLMDYLYFKHGTYMVSI